MLGMTLDRLQPGTRINRGRRGTAISGAGDRELSVCLAPTVFLWYLESESHNLIKIHFKGYPVVILRDGCATKLLITLHIFMKMFANTYKYNYCSSKLS